MATRVMILFLRQLPSLPLLRQLVEALAMVMASLQLPSQRLSSLLPLSVLSMLPCPLSPLLRPSLSLQRQDPVPRLSQQQLLSPEARLPIHPMLYLHHQLLRLSTRLSTPPDPRNNLLVVTSSNNLSPPQSSR